MTQGRHKDFSVSTKDRSPLSFTLEGEDFACRPAVPGALLLEFVGSVDSDSPTEAGDALIDFFMLALLPEEVDRFLETIRDPDLAIPIDTLAQIVEFLIEAYTSNPTKEPSRLANTRRATKATGSTAKQSPLPEPDLET